MQFRKEEEPINGMNGRMEKKTIVYGILAIVLFALLFAVTYRRRTARIEKQTVEIVTFGDSVFGEIRDETAVPVLLGKILGKSVYNGALGGTCAAKTDRDNRMDYVKGSLSLVGLAKAIAGDDFGVQQTGEYRESMMEYFAEVIDGLETIDFAKVETVLIQHGINDYHAGIPIENPEDAYDEYTYLGALRYAVEAIRNQNPDVRIVLITPTYTWYPLSGQTCEEIDNGGGVLEDYVNAEIRLATELGVEIIDLYHEYLPNESMEDYALYTRDGVHPTEEGRRMMAEKIAEVLQQ